MVETQVPEEASSAADSPSGWGSSRAYFWPVLTVSICSAVFLVLVLRRYARPAALNRPTPPPAVEGEFVSTWYGSFPLAEGELLELRLSALHPEGERQRFTALALARRLGLGAGEPWRLDVRWTAAGKSTGHGAPTKLPLQDLKLVDAQGVAAITLALDDLPKPAPALSDPLAVLCTPPLADLQCGQSVSLFFWGRPALDSVELQGWPTGATPWQLARQEISARDLPNSFIALAHADPALESGEQPKSR